MNKYHFHPITGAVGRCSAKIECPFGDLVDDHFENSSQAHQAFEKSMTNLMFGQGENSKWMNVMRDVIERSSTVLSEEAMKHRGDVRGYLMKASLDVARVSEIENVRILASLHQSLLREGSGLDSNMKKAALKVAGVLARLEMYDWRYAGGIHLLKLPDEEYDKIISALNWMHPEEDYKFTTRFGENLSREKQLEKLEHDAKKFLDESFDVNSYTMNDVIYSTDALEFDAGEDCVNSYKGNVVVVSCGNNPITVREAMLQGEKSLVVGRAAYGEASRMVRDTGRKLVEQFYVKKAGIDVFNAPEPLEDPEDEDFLCIAKGQENNAYLHKPTMMVYKIPHKESRLMGFDGQDYIENELKNYNLVNRTALAAKGVEYVNTQYFTAPFSSRGNRKISIVAQPYLDPNRYVPVDMSVMMKYDVSQVGGVDDLHPGNTKLDLKTGKIVLFDCLMDVDKDAYDENRDDIFSDRYVPHGGNIPRVDGLDED